MAQHISKYPFMGCYWWLDCVGGVAGLRFPHDAQRCSQRPVRRFCHPKLSLSITHNINSLYSPELVHDFRQTWHRDVQRFPVHADLPRLSRKVYIHKMDTQTLVPPEEPLSALKQLVVGLAEELYDVRFARLYQSSRESILNHRLNSFYLLLTFDLFLFSSQTQISNDLVKSIRC